jgi:FKBP-type peptidyl-prolyl cis-trans isomerase 2
MKNAMKGNISMKKNVLFGLFFCACSFLIFQPCNAEVVGINTFHAFSDAVDAKKSNQAQGNDVSGSGKIRIVQQGDVAEIHFLCKLKTGEVVAATDKEAILQSTLPKSPVLRLRQKNDALPVAASSSLPERPGGREWAFEDEIINRLAGAVIGMKEGEKRAVNLTAEELVERPEEAYVIRVARSREREKEMRISVCDFQARTGRLPEVGQSFIFDPAIPGNVEAVTQEEVVIRFSAQQGSVVMTPFGPGHIRETGNTYEIVVDARTGALVRSGHLIGRIVEAHDENILIDYRHPFGGETLSCDLKVEKVLKEKPLVSAAEKIEESKKR